MQTKTQTSAVTSQAVGLLAVVGDDALSPQTLYVAETDANDGVQCAVVRESTQPNSHEAAMPKLGATQSGLAGQLRVQLVASEVGLLPCGWMPNGVWPGVCVSCLVQDIDRPLQGTN
jgi:hypothetical protein